jgi:hypothetical protein
VNKAVYMISVGPDHLKHFLYTVEPSWCISEKGNKSGLLSGKSNYEAKPEKVLSCNSVLKCTFTLLECYYL